MALDAEEEDRLREQAGLDTSKTALERNRLGQFATPTGLARAILRESVTRLGGESMNWAVPHHPGEETK